VFSLSVHGLYSCSSYEFSLGVIVELPSRESTVKWQSSLVGRVAELQVSSVGERIPAVLEDRQLVKTQ
jgi:hypothetical protein